MTPLNELDWLAVTRREHEMVQLATSDSLRSCLVALGKRGMRRGRLHASPRNRGLLLPVL